ncbi:hypothetical protein C9374_004237 [Naegleria lovaniensis]|uniref:Protein kinase domain-containing protein n=1 Tax=Naegleria lovaniensis TaxID=51637 RepID=A0AA88GM47_NAELO|nr:uncharacterized protein C9374_004237 [Naegleria lovaniensis]KAG2383566.1 hypothetical protein C9374_004237 [Naegleria lovaniensis]
MYASEGEHSINYNASADIFSLGCILFALVSGLFKIQFSGQASQYIGKYVKENARQTHIAQRVLNLLLQRSENLILKIPHSVRVLIVKMLHYDPQSRPTLDEALHIIEEALKEINP